MARIVRQAMAMGLTTLLLGCSGSVWPWRDDPLVPSATDPTSSEFIQWMNGPDHLALARSLVDQGHYGVAIRQLTDTIEDKGDAPEPYYLLGVCHRETGNLTMAQHCFKRAIVMDAKFAPAYSGLGITYFLIKAFEPARLATQQAVTLDPANADYHNNLGVLLMQQNRPEEAKPCFEACLQLDPTNKRALNNLAECLLRMGQEDEALALLKGLFLPSTAYNNLGSIYLTLDRPDKAKQMFRRALYLDPSHTLARQYLNHLPEGKKATP